MNSTAFCVFGITAVKTCSYFIKKVKRFVNLLKYTCKPHRFLGGGGGYHSCKKKKNSVRKMLIWYVDIATNGMFGASVKINGITLKKVGA